MASEHFVVASVDAYWIVRAADGSRTAYDDRSAALRDAIKAAHASGERGNQAQVFTLDEANCPYPVWTYGVDSIVLS